MLNGPCQLLRIYTFVEKRPLCCSYGEARHLLSWNQKQEAWWKRPRQTHTLPTACPVSRCMSRSKAFHSDLLHEGTCLPHLKQLVPPWPNDASSQHTLPEALAFSCWLYVRPSSLLECEFREGRNCFFPSSDPNACVYLHSFHNWGNTQSESFPETKLLLWIGCYRLWIKVTELAMHCSYAMYVLALLQFTNTRSKTSPLI